MSLRPKFPIGASIAFVAGLLLACLPLRAQLDPRLQSSPTDFLNMYQQASSATPKPEVVTVFDYSGSMAALMFHPLYANLDRNDNGSQGNMTFVLTGSAGSRVVTATVQGSSVGTLTSTTLIRPDGTQVTETMAGTINTTDPVTGATLSLYPTNFATVGAKDVRNWVRAASHVRFKYTGVSPNRTVDIPIPWKVTTGASTGNPLSSLSLLDQQIKKNPNGTTTTYGSGAQIDVDRCWQIASGASIFSASSSNTNSGTSATQTSTTLMHSSGGVGMYKYAYIDWLFLGKYGTGQPYAGQYIVFDAGTNYAGGQTSATWGQGYGNAIPAGTSITVPQFDASGAYLVGKNVSGLASANVVPAYVRVQAVKRAAIQAWIQNQGDVFWAFRFLDPSSEGSPNGANIHNNSATTQNVTAGVPTTVQSGTDSKWTILNNTSAQGINATAGNSVTGMKRLASLFVGNSTPLTYAVANALAQFNDPNNVFSTVETGADSPTTCMNHFLIVFTDGIDNNNSGTPNPNGSTPYIAGQGTASASVDAVGGNKYIIANQASFGRNNSYWNLFTYAGIAAHAADSKLVGDHPETPGAYHMVATNPAAGTSDTPDKFLPFSIYQRGGVSFGAYGHRITTMTVGVSLGGYYTDDPGTYSISGKRNLYFAAAVGDPLTTTGNLITDLHSFVAPVSTPGVYDTTYTTLAWKFNDWLPNPDFVSDYPTIGIKKAGAVYFFDGSNPDLLATDLQYALYAAKQTPGTSSTATPNVPFIGTSFSHEIYLGKFIPSTFTGAMWSGDLLAFSTKTVSNQFVILDKAANPTTKYDFTTAAWSAQQVMTDGAHYPWGGRNLFTRIPVNSATIASVGAGAEPGLSRFTYTGTAFTDGTKGLTNFVGKNLVTHTVPLSQTQQVQVIQLVMGAEFALPTSGIAPAVLTGKNRSNIMGDIIDASPAVLEYNFADVQGGLSSTLKGAASSTSGVTNHFRLILAGTNQGWLHAFGEVSQQVLTDDPTSTKVPKDTINIVTGKVEELWAFLPTDFLGDLDYLYSPNTSNFISNSPHRLLVNGNPTIYFLDLPPVTGGGSGNGVVDITSAPGPERAMVIFGLGKGGRSYYAINIQNPTTPVMKWSIVPDEAAYFPSTRIPAGGPDIATVKKILTKMGFSTCPPALGRVFFNGVVRDVVFFGGGYSNTSLEHNYPIYPSPPAGQQTPMGRSVLAVDVYSGEVLAAVDLSTTLSGPIAAGVVPFEFILNSGMAQRAYFLDYAGGLWCWGSKELSKTTPTPTYGNFRMDTSDLAYWTNDSMTGGVTRAPALSDGSNSGIRKVAQDGTGSSAVYSTLPAPFRVGSFPGVGKKDSGSTAPPAVGIAMISGDRNNPLDYNYSAGNLAPTKHRLSVVFDRQDSQAWIDSSSGPNGEIKLPLLATGSRVMDFSIQTNPSAPEITPGNAFYYLAPTTGTPAVPDDAHTKFGYVIDLPTPVNGFIPKGVNTPMVVAGSLFYSYFFPTAADTCTGGTGITYTNVVCDVLNPITLDTRSNITCLSGQPGSWVGIASNFTAWGTTGVVQAGAVADPAPPVGGPPTQMQIQTFLGKDSSAHPKIRTWRTVH